MGKVRQFTVLCALLFLLLGCVPVEEDPGVSSTPAEEGIDRSDIVGKVEQLMKMRDLDAIFALENDTDFCTALSSALEDWTEYGEYPDRLSPEGQVFYLCNALQEKVFNDGLYGFILESYGRWAPETVDALETVGAPQTADILRRVIALLPNGICPKDDIERETILLDNADYYSEAYDALDDEFYADPDGDLQDLYAAYARAHRECFVQPKE